MSHLYAMAGAAQALPTLRPSRPAIYSVPRPDGLYEHWEAPPGSAVPINDDFPVPTVAHPNPIGVSVLTLGRPLPPGSRFLAISDQAKGSITPMPGILSDGPIPSGLGGALGGLGYPETTDDDVATAARAGAFAIGLAAAIGVLVVWKASR